MAISNKLILRFWIAMVAIFCALVQVSGTTQNDYLIINCDDDDVDCVISSVILTEPINLRFPRRTFFTNVRNTKRITFLNSILLQVPSSLLGDSPYLTFLNVTICEIKTINRNDFSRASNLLSFHAPGNELTIVKDFAFTGASALQELDLSDNKIEQLEKYAFDGLTQLTTLLLSYNAITNLSRTLSLLENLKVLHLDSNQLETLSVGDFQHNKLLQIIYLDNNKLSVIESDTFSHLNLIELDLASNQLFNFDLVAVSSKSIIISENQLKTISVSREVVSLKAHSNEISTVHVTSGGKFQLIQLNLSRNKLKDMANVTKISTLEQLDLSFNEVGKLNMTTFQTMKKLRVLDLEATNLSALDYGILGNELEVLDISYNNLGDIDFNIFVSLHKLKELRLDGNGLTKIPIDLTHLFPNLKSIGLSNNNWNCPHLATLIRQVNLMKIQLLTDEETMVRHRTNVHGISCTKTEEQQQSINQEKWIHPVIHENEFEKIHHKEMEKLYEKIYNVTSVIKIIIGVSLTSVLVFFIVKFTYNFLKKRNTINYHHNLSCAMFRDIGNHEN